MDIINKRFHKKFRGLDDVEIYAFLGIIREEMEELIRENFVMKEKIIDLENQIKVCRDLEVSVWKFVEQCISLKKDSVQIKLSKIGN